MNNAAARRGQPAPALCLMGPTASGKTDLAIELVRRLPVEIISVDSAQIYRGMDIGTGKPDAGTLREAPHRLIDILDPAESYSAADFRRDALREMQAITEAGKIPLLVGGTMLYFKALRDGLAELPAADPESRREIEEIARRSGWAGVHRRLAAVDPDSAARIHPNDPQRLQRALEVWMLSGKSLTELQRSGPGTRPDEPEFQLHFMALEMRRSLLHERIRTRFLGMLEAGLVGEVELLYARDDLSLELPSMRCVGYRQVWQHLAGELRFDAMVERGIIATRQLAKRQVTWLRGWKMAESFDSESHETLNNILKFVRRISI